MRLCFYAWNFRSFVLWIQKTSNLSEKNWLTCQKPRNHGHCGLRRYAKKCYLCLNCCHFVVVHHSVVVWFYVWVFVFAVRWCSGVKSPCSVGKMFYSILNIVLRRTPVNCVCVCMSGGVVFVCSNLASPGQTLAQVSRLFPVARFGMTWYAAKRDYTLFDSNLMP